MKLFVKKSISVILVLALLCSALVGASAKTSKTHYNYEKYVLLGDSVASGHDDILYAPTEFMRIEGSYSDLVAKELGAELIPMACPGFRTMEIRYMLEDDFNNTDDYLFYGTIDKEVMKSRIPEYRKNIAEADLITLGVGGNDFGTVLTWIVADVMEEKGMDPQLIEKIRGLTSNIGIGTDMVDKIVELANTMNALPELLQVIPPALARGLAQFFINWNYMIEDIYALNPDVTLVVVGMFDNAVKSAEDVANSEADAAKLSIGQLIVEMANTPMKIGAEKYGYTYVDTTGTICVTYHPTAEGHRHIADRILEALPDATHNYTDVKSDSFYFEAVNYLHRYNIMKGVSEKTFDTESAITKATLAEAFYKAVGSPDVSDLENPFSDVKETDKKRDAIVWATSKGILSGTEDGKFDADGTVSILDFALSLFIATSAKNPTIVGILKGLYLTATTIFEEGIFNLKNPVSRGTAAFKIYSIAAL